jgi:eukaryotic-like serine/threonine-protein kinase
MSSSQYCISARSQYRLLGQVGQGQFAQVFCGIHRETSTVVALKKLDCQRLPAHTFLQELHLLSRLRHPNIVRFHALAYDAKSRYLVTDYCSGGTLRDLMESGFPLKLTDCLQIIIDILQGLEKAHQIGVVHCDLKPENILLVPTVSGWTAQIADFGVAQFMDTPHRQPALIGSPAYKAPECHYQHFSDASDLYAVGVLLFELIVGQRPFIGMPGELMSAHLNQAPDLPSTVPFPVRSLLTTALQKLPQRRFASARAMLQSVQLATAIMQASQPETLAGGHTAPPIAAPLAHDQNNPQAQPIPLWCRQITQNWGEPEQVIAFNQRHALAIVPEPNHPDYRIWRLFNRRGGFIDYCRLPATQGALIYSQNYPYQVWAVDALNPTIAWSVDLKPLQIKRIALTAGLSFEHKQVNPENQIREIMEFVPN